MLGNQGFGWIKIKRTISQFASDKLMYLLNIAACTIKNLCSINHKYKHDVDETNSILQSGVPGAAGSQQMTSLGWCRIQTSYAVSQYRLKLPGPQGYLFRTTVSNWQAPRVIFTRRKARVQSLAAEGSQRQDLKTCL